MFKDWEQRIKDNPQVSKFLLWDIDMSNLTDEDMQKMKVCCTSCR